MWYFFLKCSSTASEFSFKQLKHIVQVVIQAVMLHLSWCYQTKRYHQKVQQVSEDNTGIFISSLKDMLPETPMGCII